MKKMSILFLLLTLYLGACAPKPMSDSEYNDWRHSMKSPVRSDMVYGGNTVITQERKVEPIDLAKIKLEEPKQDHMLQMANIMRQKLTSKGGQVKQEKSIIYARIPTSVIFGGTRMTISDFFRSVLDPVAETIKEHPEIMVRIMGHTDNTMGVVPSQKLSLRQATILRNYLNTKGVELERCLAEGKGSLEPIASNATSATRAQNNYMEIVIYNLK